MMQAVNIPLHEEGQEWQHFNIVDRSLLTTLVKRVLTGSCADMRISTEACNVLSNGLQMHLKSLLEASVKVSRCRTNKASFNSYDGLAKMVVDHGKGYPLPENQFNIAMKWAPDAHTALLAEETEARRVVAASNAAEEEALAMDMAAYDEERLRISSSAAKRKMQDVDTPWWQKDVRRVFGV
jgi:hypothetical protein